LLPVYSGSCEAIPLHAVTQGLEPNGFAFGGDDLTLKGGRDAFDPAMIGRRPIEHDLGLGDR